MRRLGLPLSEEWLDAILVLLFICAFLNVAVALVSRQAELYRIVPLWIYLLAICLSSRHLANQRFLAAILTVLLCLANEYIKYQTMKAEIMVRIMLVYTPLALGIIVLVSTKIDSLRSQYEHLHAKVSRLKGDANKLLKDIQKIRTGGEEKGLGKQEETLAEKRALFNFYQDAFKAVAQVRFKRDIPTMIQTLAERLGLQHGAVLEAPDDRGKEFRVRTFWGLPQTIASKQVLNKHKDCDLTRWAADRKGTLGLDEIKRQPNLYEAHDQFIQELFPIEVILPITHLDKTLFIAYLGKQGPQATIEFKAGILTPVLEVVGQAIGKIMSRDGRPSFSVFLEGS